MTDPTDPRLVHLDGLNLSRAWMLQGNRGGPAGRPTRAAPCCSRPRPRTQTAGLARVASGDYAGEHWLATFAVYLLTE